MLTQLTENLNALKQLLTLPAIESELKKQGYNDEEIHDKIAEIEPEASELLNKIKELSNRMRKLQHN